MAPSTSTGRMSNREKIPHEIRGRMTWDPHFRQQIRARYAYGSDDDSDEDDENNVPEYEYPTSPYVSGGLQTNGHATNGTPNPSNTPGKRQANAVISNGATKIGASNDGFQRVSYKRPTRNNEHANGKQPQKPRVPRRLDLNLNKDNYAKACFRNRDEATGEFVLPKDCNEIEPDKAKMYDYLEELGVRLGSFICPPQHIKDRTLLLWGKSEAIERTTQELKEWLRPSKPIKAMAPGPSKPRAGENFAESRSTRGDPYKRAQDAIKKKAELQRFQQVPAKGQLFDCTGTFLWPVEEVRPQDILGDGLEALDPVRMAYKCHIIFDDQRSVFRILTNNIASVQKTLSRIAGIMKEYVARTQRPITRYYIQPSSISVHRKDIRIAPSQASVSLDGAPQVPTLTGMALEPAARAGWLKVSADLVAQSNRGIEDALHKTIPNLVFYRGQVRMRVHFGTFGLTVFRWPGTATSIPFKDFMGNMAMAGTKGMIIRDLCTKKDATTILGKIYNANELLQPIDNQVMTLAEVTPAFTAYFECQENDKGPLKLEVELNENAAAKDLYEKTYALWSKLGRRDNSTPLDIFMIRLDGGPSWKFRASTENHIDFARISPKMVQFVESIKLNKEPNTTIELSGDKVFRWDKNPGCLLVTAFQQKTALRFRLVKNMDYILEIARYDLYERQEEENRPTQTNWGATLWNTEWDAELMANGSLGIGEEAHWDPRLRTFFPSQSTVSFPQEVDQGVMEFLKIVGDVNEFLNDIMEEVPHLRGS